MTETQKNDPATEQESKKAAKKAAKKSAMTAAEAAKLVKRMVAKTDAKGAIVRDADGNPVTVAQGIKADEVMSFAEYADRVVVVTTSGEKLEASK